MLYKIRLGLILTFLQYNQAIIRPFPDEQTPRESLTRCIVEGAKRYFSEAEMITVSLTSKEVKNNVTSSVVLDRLLLPALFAKGLWTVMLTNPLKRRRGIYRKSDSYIIQIRRQQELKFSLEVLKSYPSWNPHAKFVVISATVFEIQEEVVTSIVETLWSANIVQGVIMLPAPEDHLRVNVFSWFPYENGSCGNDFDRTVIIDKCKLGNFETYAQWFANKIPDQLNGCPIRVRVVSWPPYVLKPKTHIQGTDLYEFDQGVEIELMKNIAKRVNLNVIYSMSDKRHDWGDVTANGTVTGGFQKLKEGHCDIIMSSYGLRHSRSEMFDATKSYIQESLTWCVPHAKSEKYFEKFTDTMQPETWYLIIVAYFMLSVIVWALSRLQDHESQSYKSLPSTMQNAFSILLGMAVKVQPKTTLIRSFMFLWVLTALVLDTEYTTYMISALTGSSYQKQIKTLEEILDSNLDVLILPNSILFFKDSQTGMRRLRQRWKICTNMEECLNNTAFKRKSAVCVPRLYQSYVFNMYRDANNEPLLYCFKESIVSYSVVMYMTKGYPLINRINELIEMIKCAGLIDLWQKRVYGRRWDNVTLEDEQTDDDPKWMNLGHLQVIFITLAIGLTFAFCAFIGEIIWYKYNSFNCCKHYKACLSGRRENPPENNRIRRCNVSITTVYTE